MNPIKLYHVVFNGVKKTAVLLHVEDQARKRKHINKDKVNIQANVLTRQIKQILEKGAETSQNTLHQDIGIKHLWL